jgi:hypothetical protein
MWVDASNRKPHKLCFLLEVGTMEWAPCTKLFLKWFLWTYMMLGSTTNSNNRWEILKCPPPPTPLYEFVYGFGQIDWDAKIPSTSHVVLMTSHLNGLETFPIFPKNIWWVYVKVTNSQRMGIGTWGWDNPCQRDAFGLHLKGSFWETFKTFTLMWPVLVASPSVNKTLMLEPTCGKII